MGLKHEAILSALEAQHTVDTATALLVATGEKHELRVDLTDSGPRFYARIAGVEAEADNADAAVAALPAKLAAALRERLSSTGETP